MPTYDYLTDSGVIVPDTSTILTDVQNEFKSVLGADLNVSLSTPQGVMIVAEAEARDSVARNNAALANQINPNQAGGIFLDSICGLTGLTRTAATRTVATCTLTGQPSTVIPEGSQARTAAGDVFESLAAVSLNSSGNATVQFRALEYGPIPALAGSINQIVSGGVLGWETITNPDNAAVGVVGQSDAALRQQRKDTLALQGVALPEAITSALYALEGVKSLAFRENVEDTTQVIDGISLVAHSIFVCVDGGDNTEVATAILANKSLGCNFNGDTTVNVTEPSSGQVYPVKFERPQEISVLVKVTVSPQGSVANPSDAVIAAVLAYVNGEIPGEKGYVVGGDVSPFEISGAVNYYYPGMYVKKVEIALYSGSPVYSTDDILIEIDQVARTISGNIVVVVV